MLVLLYDLFYFITYEMPVQTREVTSQPRGARFGGLPLQVLNEAPAEACGGTREPPRLDELHPGQSGQSTVTRAFWKPVLDTGHPAAVVIRIAALAKLGPAAAQPRFSGPGPSPQLGPPALMQAPLRAQRGGSRVACAYSCARSPPEPAAEGEAAGCSLPTDSSRLLPKRHDLHWLV